MTHILVVADDAAELAALGRALEEVGFRAELETHPEVARHRIAVKPPDLLVLDSSIPRVTLLRLYSTLRDLEADARIPVIFTRHPDVAKEREGADFYLSSAADARAVAILARDVIGTSTKPTPVHTLATDDAYFKSGLEENTSWRNPENPSRQIILILLILFLILTFLVERERRRGVRKRFHRYTGSPRLRVSDGAGWSPR